MELSNWALLLSASVRKGMAISKWLNEICIGNSADFFWWLYFCHLSSSHCRIQMFTWRKEATQTRKDAHCCRKGIRTKLPAAGWCSLTESVGAQCGAGSSQHSGRQNRVAGIQQSNQNHRWTRMSQGQGAGGQAGVRAKRSKMSAFLLLRGSGTRYLPWARQPENIPLVKTGDSKPGSSAGSTGCVCAPASSLQHKARVEVSVGLTASGETETQLDWPRGCCGQCSCGDQLPLQSPLGKSSLPKHSLFLHRLLLKAGDFLSGSLLAPFLETYHCGKFLSAYLLDYTKHAHIYV